MSAKKPAHGAMRQAIDVRIGQRELLVGELVYAKAGPREYSEFAYGKAWLENPEKFEVSPHLALVPGYTSRKAPSRDDSCFPLALADTGRRSPAQPGISPCWQRPVAACAGVRPESLSRQRPGIEDMALGG